VLTCIGVYNAITTQLLPTPSKSHYTFNLRDLSKVIQGLLMTDASKFEVCRPVPFNDRFFPGERDGTETVQVSPLWRTLASSFNPNVLVAFSAFTLLVG